MKTKVLLVCVAILVATAAAGQNKPDGKSAKPSVSGPGTQTEDELYIGARKPTGPKSTSGAGMNTSKPTANTATPPATEAAAFKRRKATSAPADTAN